MTQAEITLFEAYQQGVMPAIIQPFVNRSGEGLDIGADAVGILLSLAIGQIFREAS